MGYFGTVKARVCIQNVSLQSEYLGTQIFFAFFQGDRKFSKNFCCKLYLAVFSDLDFWKYPLCFRCPLCLCRSCAERRNHSENCQGVCCCCLSETKKYQKKSPRKQCFICSLIWIKSLGKLLRACCCCPSKTKPNYICCKKSYLQDITFTKYHIDRISYFQNIIFTRYYIYKISY